MQGRLVHDIVIQGTFAKKWINKDECQKVIMAMTKASVYTSLTGGITKYFLLGAKSVILSFIL